jgi:hypothetical protein
MTKLIVEIDDVKDVRLFRIFAERLGFNVTQEKNSSPRKDLTYHKSIIAKGIQRPLSHLEERLTYLQADRQDRILPNR